MKREKGFSIQKDEDSIHVFALNDQCFSIQDKKDLWTEYNILYLGGVMALWVEERTNNNPLVHLMGEDDGHIFWHRKRDDGYVDFCFDSSWVDNYIETLTELKKRLSI